MGAGASPGLLIVKSGFILFIKSYQFPLQINTFERERELKIAENVFWICSTSVLSKARDFLFVPTRDQKSKNHLFVIYICFSPYFKLIFPFFNLFLFKL